MKAKLFILGILVTFVAFNLSAQNQETKKKKYAKFGFVAKTFNNSSLKEEAGGEFLGFEIQGGVEVQNNLTAELSNSLAWRNLGEDERLNYWELGVLFDYHPDNFYIGAGPTFVSLEDKYKVDTDTPGFSEQKSDSYYAIGFVGRIGFTAQLTNNFGLYFEVKYSKINLEENEEIINIGTAGFSIGLKF